MNPRITRKTQKQNNKMFLLVFGGHIIVPLKKDSRGQHLWKFIGANESVYIRREFNSHKTGLGHKHGRRFIVLGHKYGRHDVMWKRTIFIFFHFYFWWCDSETRNR